MRDDPVGDEVQRAVGGHLDVVGHRRRRTARSRRSGRRSRACASARWCSTTNLKSSGVTTTYGQVAVLLGEVRGRTVHAVHLPVDAVEVEVADAPVGERPCASRSRCPARSATRTCRARAGSRTTCRWTRSSSGRSPGRCRRPRGRARSDASICAARHSGSFGPKPLDALVHRRDAGARQIADAARGHAACARPSPRADATPARPASLGGALVLLLALGRCGERESSFARRASRCFSVIIGSRDQLGARPASRRSRL